MKWMACFHLNSDAKPSNTDTDGFNFTKSPPFIKEPGDFALVTSIKLRKVNTELQRKLKEDYSVWLVTTNY